MKDFIEKIIENLESNGFPTKRVSLPTEKMFEAADNRGLSFNKVLGEMRDEYQINSIIEGEKIIFSHEYKEDAPRVPKEDLYKQAQDMMSQMTPEELQKMQDTILNMSPEQKEELMKKGKDLGLI